MELDIKQLRSQVLDLRETLAEGGYRVQTVLLFGSYAKGLANANSDIDSAFVSRDYSVDPFKENSLLNYLFY